MARGRAVFVERDRLASVEAHPAASHTEHVLIFILDGWVRIEYGSPVVAEPGSMVIVPAGIPHRHLTGGDTERWVVGFCAASLGLDEGQLLMAPFVRVRHGAAPIATIAAGRRRRVARLFRELREENERAVAQSPELSKCLLLLLLGELDRAMPQAEACPPCGSLVAGALAFIQRRALDTISLRDVAAAVHRTPSHVATTVKKATGYSVGEWIAAARVTEAAAWLLHSEDSLEVIAGRVGWRDVTHFIRQFRKVHGQTPAAWRRAQRRRHGRGGVA